MKPWQKLLDQNDKFSGLADLYDQYRPSYPSDLIDHLVALSNINKQSYITDLGCGTGQLSLEFAKRGYANVTAIDMEQDMLNVGQKKAYGNNIDWVCSRAEDFTFFDDKQQLVTLGKSFHWMDRTLVLNQLYNAMATGGVCAIIWQDQPKHIQQQWKDDAYKLALEITGYESIHSDADYDSHEIIAKKSKFNVLGITDFEHSMERTIDSIIYHYLSFSWCNERVLGDKKDEFFRRMYNLLETHNTPLTENISTSVLVLQK